MSDLLSDRIKQRLSALGMTMREASIKATGSAETIRAIVNGKSQNPRVDTLAKIAEVLGTSPEWLTGRGDASEPSQLSPAPVAMPPRISMPADVPVLGTAAGSLLGGAFQIEGGVIDYVRRPPALSGARDIYALYVEGTSMEPLYRPGGLVFVHPHKPPRIGDSVIVQIRNGEHDSVQASIGYLRGRTALHVVLGKLNPVAEINLNRDTVVAIHRVLDMNELFGV
ncbi:helix-turn-helix domain-containing protein [uncultured Hoeflea sp.]|uniref:XRE family transcriptional regulator n=1 Tax=uncultured Hoeflea sp. TaxID=538666 RepID=UPI0030DC780E|tara:strand:+ start:1150 stop:1824 length:675 start_codon:yes stop_codon:yes gene_type:complete